MDSPIVACRDLSYAYPEDDRLALDGVDVALEPGSFTVLTGGSGSGKSTLLRALCGLVPHFHGGEVSGELEVAGLSVRDHGPADLAAVAGTVFQDPETQVVMTGVRAELALALEHRGEADASVQRSVEEVALELGIGGLLHRRTDTLSGGELQRVAIAAALIHGPRILLLDEPTSQLDPVAGDELIWLLRRLNEEHGTAVVIAEHRIERCLGAADRVLALDRGKLVCDESPSGFLAWAADHRRGLLPPVARLFSDARVAPLPVTVRAARDRLRETGLDTLVASAPERARPDSRPALSVRGLWREIEDGPVVLRGVDLAIHVGERVALMGRNGAGKSTLLRLLKGLDDPTRGDVERAGEVALLLQHPGDYLLGDRIGADVGTDALMRAGLADRAAAHPRDLSGGERQRLALEIALGEGGPAVALLDEPTRGMDAESKLALIGRIDALAAAGAAVVVATHDTEFAASFADRVVLMGEGCVIADDTPEAVLCAGMHWTTGVARAMGPQANALTPERGAAAIDRALVA